MREIRVPTEIMDEWERILSNILPKENDGECWKNIPDHPPDLGTIEDATSRYLLRYYNENTHVPSQNLKVAGLLVDYILHRIYTHVTEDRIDGDPIVEKFSRTGSAHEGLKCVKPDEFDVLLPIKLPAVQGCQYEFVRGPDEGVPAGYMAVKVKDSEDGKKRNRHLHGDVFIKKVTKHSASLDTLCVRSEPVVDSWGKSAVQRALNKIMAQPAEEKIGEAASGAQSQEAAAKERAEDMEVDVVAEDLQAQPEPEETDQKAEKTQAPEAKKIPLPEALTGLVLKLKRKGPALTLMIDCSNLRAKFPVGTISVDIVIVLRNEHDMAVAKQMKGTNFMSKKLNKRHQKLIRLEDADLLWMQSFQRPPGERLPTFLESLAPRTEPGYMVPYIAMKVFKTIRDKDKEKNEASQLSAKMTSYYIKTAACHVLQEDKEGKYVKNQNTLADFYLALLRKLVDCLDKKYLPHCFYDNPDFLPPGVKTPKESVNVFDVVKPGTLTPLYQRVHYILVETEELFTGGVSDQTDVFALHPNMQHGDYLDMRAKAEKRKDEDKARRLAKQAKKEEDLQALEGQVAADVDKDEKKRQSKEKGYQNRKLNKGRKRKSKNRPSANQRPPRLNKVAGASNFF